MDVKSKATALDNEKLVFNQKLIDTIDTNLKNINTEISQNASKNKEVLSNINENLIHLKNSLPTIEEYKNIIQPVTEELAKNNELIQESTIKLTAAISTIPEGSYGLAIVSGIVGAIVAAIAVICGNFYYFGKLNKKNKKAHNANIALKLLEYFESTSTEYWISECKKDRRNVNINDKEMKLLEVKIKSEFTVLRHCLADFSELLESSESIHKDFIGTFIDDVYDLAMGGEFESNNKKTDKKTTLEISQKCSSLKAILIKYSQHIN